jgi:maltose O-acetyltransferase
MVTERERMLAGELYDPLDAELVAARRRARALCLELNAMPEDETAARRALLASLFACGGDTVGLQPPFQCDYGAHIHLGSRGFFNFNCVVLDVCDVRIGDRTLFGPGVQFLTPLHPWSAVQRRTQEYGKPIAIGDDCWIGGGAQILAGVRIGSRTVIGAGSVVARDIPDDVFAAGNPCRVVRRLE